MFDNYKFIRGTIYTILLIKILFWFIIRAEGSESVDALLNFKYIYFHTGTKNK